MLVWSAQQISDVVKDTSTEYQHYWIIITTRCHNLPEFLIFFFFFSFLLDSAAAYIWHDQIHD